MALRPLRGSQGSARGGGANIPPTPTRRPAALPGACCGIGPGLSAVGGVPGEQSILGSVLPPAHPSSRGRAGARKSTHPQKRRFAFIEGVYNKSLCLCLLLSQIHPSPSLGLGTATHLSRLLGGASIRTGQGGSISVSLAPGPAPGSSLVLSIG